MGKFVVEHFDIEGLTVVTPVMHKDSRGYFMELYNQRDYRKIGIDCKFVQDNQANFHYGVLRGLHYQTKYPQDKMVRVVKGIVYDVAVDLREGSPTFGKWQGVLLSSKNRKQFFIPKGFAHGFLVLTDTAILAYKCSAFFHANDEAGIVWDDPDIGIAWPIKENMNLIISDKDKKWGSFADYLESR